MEYNKRLNAAARLDRKARALELKEEEADSDTEMEEAARKPGPSIRDLNDTETDAAVQGIVDELRGKFGSHVIRRTGASKDNEGKPLAGIAPAREHVLMLDLYDREYDFLAGMHEDFQKSDGSKKVKASHQVSCIASLQRRRASWTHAHAGAYEPASLKPTAARACGRDAHRRCRSHIAVVLTRSLRRTFT